MSLAPPFLTPFVGREKEKQLYQQLLTQPTPWLLLITGQGGIGKSRLLERLADETPPDVVTLTLNFARDELRIDPLTVLEELLPQAEPFVDVQQMQAAKQALADGRSKLSHPAGNLTQEIHLAESATLQGQGMQLNINTATLELRRQIRAQATQAFYDLILTLAGSHLVLLLDTCEWLGEAEASEVGQWLLNDLLPSLHERLHRRSPLCSFSHTFASERVTSLALSTWSDSTPGLQIMKLQMVFFPLPYLRLINITKHRESLVKNHLQKQGETVEVIMGWLRLRSCIYAAHRWSGKRGMIKITIIYACGCAVFSSDTGRSIAYGCFSAP